MKWTRIFALVALSLPATSAQTQVHSYISMGTNALPMSRVIEIPKFDPSLGTLRQVVYNAQVRAYWDVSLENLNFFQVPFCLNENLDNFQVSYNIPLANVDKHYELALPQQCYLLGPFDGSLDFQGPSSWNVTYIDTPHTDDDYLTYIQNNTNCTNHLVGHGTYEFVLEITDTALYRAYPQVIGNINTSADIIITVTYVYE